METGGLFVYIKDEVIKMSAKVKVKNGNFLITIPVKEAYENRSVRNLLDTLRCQDILSRSKATEEQINTLADEVTGSWWKENRERFLNGTGN